MANKTHAKEWLEKAYHDLDSANILIISGHFTDTIGYIYHQSIEKIYKSIIAFENIFMVEKSQILSKSRFI